MQLNEPFFTNVTFLSSLEQGSEMALAADLGVVSLAVTHTHAVSSGGLTQ